MATADDRKRLMRSWVEKAARKRGLDPEKALSASREQSCVAARHAAIRFADEMGWSANAIAKALGQHHTTILSALGRLGNG